MPLSLSSPARNLFLLGSSGGDVVTNFFITIDQSSTTDLDFLPDEIKYNPNDQKYILAGTATDSLSKNFGWFEKRSVSGASDYNLRIESSSGNDTTLRAMELDINNNLTVVGKTGSVPWIAKYSNGGVIDWQSTTNSGDVEYTGITSDANGNYYACGSTPVAGQAQAFIEKFDSSGTPGWGKSAFMLGRDVVLNKVATNSRGEVVAVGYLEDDSKFKGYIVKIDTNTGEVLWDRTLETEKIQTIIRPCLCEDVYIDSNDQIYVVGRLFGNSSTISFIIKYTAEGNMIWQRETPAGENFEYYQVKSDGETEQTIVLGRYFNVSQNKFTGVLVKYSKDGTVVWRRTILSSFGATRTPINLDADPSFYYLLYTDKITSDRYTFGKVSTSGNGLGDFEYTEGTGQTIDYIAINTPDVIGRLSDGSVRQDSSDLITYPFSANKLLFDDLATQVSNKKRQMDSADSFEYSGSPAIRPADFQELNLLGDVYSGSGDWLDQSGKGNDGVVNGATHNAAGGYWEFPGGNTDNITLSNLIIPATGEFTVEWWYRLTGTTGRGGLFEREFGTATYNGFSLGQGGAGDWSVVLSSNSNYNNREIDVPFSSYPTLNTWYHEIAVFNGTNTMTLYRNGVQDATQTAGTNVGNLDASGTRRPLQICYRDVVSANNSIPADVGEVRIYPRALTPAQVFQNYNATKSKYINEAPDTAPKIGPGIVYGSNLLLNYDFGNRATYDRAENVVGYSEDFTITGSGRWASAGNLPDANVTANYAMSPTGEMKATKMINTEAAPRFRRWQPNITANGAYDTSGTWNCSVYAKALSNPCVLRINSYDGVSDKGTFFNLVDGVVNSSYGSPDATSVEAVGNGWYRISQTTTNAAQGGDYQLHLDPGADLLMFGAQMEQGNTPGRYIKTSGSAITAPTTVKNLSSTSYTGTINGATFNNAGYFTTGSNLWVSSGYGATGTSDMTIEQWVRASNFPVTFHATFYSQSSNASGFYGIGYATTNGWFFGDYNGSVRNVASGGTAAINTWYHFVGRRSGGNLTVWINGTNVTVNSASTSISFTAADPRIGSNPAAPTGEYWNGDIAETRIYNRALTATEVSQNFNATRSKYGV